MYYYIKVNRYKWNGRFKCIVLADTNVTETVTPSHKDIACQSCMQSMLDLCIFPIWMLNMPFLIKSLTSEPVDTDYWLLAYWYPDREKRASFPRAPFFTRRWNLPSQMNAMHLSVCFSVSPRDKMWVGFFRPASWLRTEIILRWAGIYKVYVIAVGDMAPTDFIFSNCR